MAVSMVVSRSAGGLLALLAGLTGIGVFAALC
jgi:hypothetical protein